MYKNSKTNMESLINSDFLFNDKEVFMIINNQEINIKDLYPSQMLQF